MATYTEHYNLIKPALNDKVNINNLNDNADIIDAALNNKVNTDDTQNIITSANNCMMSDGVTSVEDAVDAVKPKTVKSVTADGIKTYAQLLMELAALGSGGNALKMGSLVHYIVNGSNYFACYFGGTNIIDIFCIYMTSSSAIYKCAAINNDNTVSWIDKSNDVPASGTKIEKVII